MKTITLLALALILVACETPHTVPKVCKEECAPFTVDTFTDPQNDLLTVRTWCKCSKTERAAPPNTVPVPVPNVP